MAGYLSRRGQVSFGWVGQVRSCLGMVRLGEPGQGIYQGRGMASSVSVRLGSVWFGSAMQCMVFIKARCGPVWQVGARNGLAVRGIYQGAVWFG